MFSTSGFRKTAHFRFEVGTGNRKVDDAKAEGEIHTPCYRDFRVEQFNLEKSQYAYQTAHFAF